MWEVVESTRGAVRVRCRHRWEVTATFCAMWRDRGDWLTPERREYHDVRWAAEE